MADYNEQIEFHEMIDGIKKGDFFTWHGTSNRDSAKNGDVYVALSDRPDTLSREKDTGRYIIIRSPDGRICLSTGDIKKRGYILQGNERIVTKPLNRPPFWLSLEPNAPVVSDGKSSSYYNLLLNERLTKKIKDQLEKGEPLNLETGDIIEMMFGNDFDFGNIEKALRRIFEAKHGRGKAGVDIKYDINKCHYFLDQIEEKC